MQRCRTCLRTEVELAKQVNKLLQACCNMLYMVVARITTKTQATQNLGSYA